MIEVITELSLLQSLSRAGSELFDGIHRHTGKPKEKYYVSSPTSAHHRVEKRLRIAKSDELQYTPTPAEMTDNTHLHKLKYGLFMECPFIPGKKEYY